MSSEGDVPANLESDPAFLAGQNYFLLGEMERLFRECDGWTPSATEFAEREGLLGYDGRDQQLRRFYAIHHHALEALQYGFAEQPTKVFTRHLPVSNHRQAEVRFVAPRPLADDMSDENDPAIDADPRLRLAVALSCSLLCKHCVNDAIACLGEVRLGLATAEHVEWTLLTYEEKRIVRAFFQLTPYDRHRDWLGRQILSQAGLQLENKKAKRALPSLVRKHILAKVSARKGYRWLRPPKNVPPSGM